ncbi:MULTISPECIES: hypothetical protein [unclassified Variovorax]|uniref:hypothetical protein n=1 Tax=unclassified Variovorax TaxID=663243 RepID=UPI00076BDB8C|nr:MULTISPECIES: hypothetical protein [unclassified Variovorax]KWT68511.1 hypothetical protein APY03_7018 [Variovorax sp. WDL1]PNG46630.1 hypothetical protein CHC06_06973 [Variovorax sp. B2]PNG48719.1 hypothetical protein CHC07_07895 [Variovorax sp. B4]VTV14411.1 hypothetical protein WDL1CHR_04946 [Variovorax sp. WDL1]
MPPVLHPPRFRGLRFAATDAAAVASVFDKVLGIAALPPRATADSSCGRFLLDDQWLEVRTAAGDTLDLGCDDLGTQRTHLRRLGIEALDGSTLGCTPRLRLDAMDTGACTVDLREQAAPVGSAEDGGAAVEGGADRLCGLELAVRAPERVALHWAQLFSARSSRDERGLPFVTLPRLDLRFTLAADGRTGVTALEFAAAELAPLVRNASAQGFDVCGDARRAAFSTRGIAFRLRADR